MENDNQREVLARNLRKFMSLSNTTQTELTQSLNLAQSTVSSWVNGEKYPRVERLEQLANYFGITTSDLTESKGKITRHKIPLLGIVPCGEPIEAVEEVVDYIDVLPNMIENHFALYAKGDSMFPKIEDGDILVIEHTPNVDSGTIAIIKVNGDEATCKKIVKNKNGITLIPLNPMFDQVIYSPDEVATLPVTIIGRVKEIRRTV